MFLSETALAAITTGFAEIATLSAKSVDLPLDDISIDQFELATAIRAANTDIEDHMRARRVTSVSPGRLAGILCYWLRAYRPLQIVENSRSSTTRFQEVVILMFIFDYVLKVRPPERVFAELLVALKYNRMNTHSLSLLFEVLGYLSDDPIGEEFMDRIE